MRRLSLGLCVLSIGLCATAPVLAQRVAAGLFGGPHAPTAVGAPPPSVGSLDASACAGCHSEIAAEWASSLHRRSWTDPVFQAAFVEEPLDSCRNCHAPMRAPGEAPSGLAAHDGITCATCHVRDGLVLATRDSGRSPHALEVVPELAGSVFCAGCHQFDFPAERGAARGHPPTDEPMQDTYEEWAASRAAADGVQCQGCHMPAVGGHRSHRFDGSRDLAMLQRAVRVEASVRADVDTQVVTIRVEPGDIGHAFPTGDLFRRVELSVSAGDEAPAVVAFARDFSDVAERMPDGTTAFVRRERADSRVPPPGYGPSAPHVFRFPRAAGPVRWSLDHLLMPSPMAAAQGFAAARVRRVVHSGTLTLTQENP